MSKQAISLEAVLDEERKDVLALLEGLPSKARHRGSTGSMGSLMTSGPFTRQSQSPVRSMLDVDDGTEPGRISLPGDSSTDAPKPERRGSQTIRSMLDMSPSPNNATGTARSMLDIGAATGKRRASSSASTQSAVSSPTDNVSNDKAQQTNGRSHRSLSDAGRKPASSAPRPTITSGTPESSYQFGGYTPSHGGPVAPKRNTLGGRKTSAMAEVVRGGTISFFGDKDRGRNKSIPTTRNTTKSSSPVPRSILRPSSPSVRSDTSKFVLNDGRVLDMNNAYRRLSDANLARSGGGLFSLGEKSQRSRANSDGVPSEIGARLEKDYANVNIEDVIVDSSEDDDSISDDNELRGRKHEKRSGRANPNGSIARTRKSKGARPAQSLMAAAEEERDQIAAEQHEKYKISSLLDPEITVTSPGGDRHLRAGSATVHPNTSFDEGNSGLNTPVDSDEEQDVTDIKHAQKLPFSMTAITSTPGNNRCVRTIYRGDFSKMQQEAKDHQRRVRKYLVATDLSDEAAHALEWTVGTVLRDGDTLLAIYCVDEDVGIANNDSEDDSKTREQIAAIQASTRGSGSTPLMSPTAIPSPLGPGFRLDPHSASASPVGREKSKAEHERYRAVSDITDRVSRLLRKTKLQVKVVVEVIHCKSPKHLITEVIDYISPTMVILGSRGQSQLKGVILGSFSNYLVTKSSVPVMVARKRLRKHMKYRRPAIRLANNLANPAVRGLAAAKID
ncbi:uncharacterized protein RSE6_00700 [Rhynchosporium secalis]|uniref:UspA domain-containing protein n=1 Tax=Rhynchosporium secalis TaxID=38038 RepID=A0A1E1LW07_RHYSE|nr:uncharacterized protein RSE6_00700 [Rhynchosporium secalis]